MKKRVIKILLFVFLGIFILPIGSFEFAVLLSGPLSPQTPGYLLMHDEKGDDRYYSRNHATDYLFEEDIPDYVFSYLVGLEDQNFYNHSGYDLARIIKSGFDNISSGEIVAGGSTITQQVARLLYLNNDKSYFRKIKEVYYARRLEKGLSKKAILVLYLNVAYFGENIYGLEAAARSYFNCSGRDITKSMAILLLSLLPSPNNYSPRVNSELSKNVYVKAVDRLYYRNVLNSEEIEGLYASYPQCDSGENLNSADNFYYQAVESVLADNRVKINVSDIEVSTYMNRELQEEAQSYIKQIVTENGAEGGVVIMEPNTGIVKALVGGKSDYSFNRATQTNKDIGSVAKPLLYTIALENGFSPLNTFVSEPTTFFLEGGKTYSPKNPGNKYAMRKINMVEAIGLSDNIFASKLGLLIGSSSLAAKLAKIDEKIEVNVSDSLGSFALSLIKLTAVYNALASGGKYYEPRLLSACKVNGNAFSLPYDDVQLFDEKCSRIMSYLLRATYDPGLQSYANPTMLYYPLNKNFAVKTGTTKSAAFVVGYTPSVTIGVYVGKDDDSELTDPGAAKRLFKKVADRATLKDYDNFFSTANLDAFQMHNSSTDRTSFVYYR